MSDCEIVVRPARAEDLPARERLVRDGVSSHWQEAFIYFFFDELTLELCVLCGAVMFIFMGCDVRVCVCVVPCSAALLVALLVTLKHAALAETHVQRMHSERFGLVATVRPQVPHHYGQVIGTVSVSENWNKPYSGWMHALAVSDKWRRKGAGRQLVRGAREAARGAAGCGGGRGGGGSLATTVSRLQGAVRELLYHESWQGGWYQRRLCGAALTLPLVTLTTPLHPQKNIM